MNNTLSEEDLLRLFSSADRRHNRHFSVMNFLFRLLIAASLVAISYIMINFSAFSSKLGFWYKNDFSTEIEDSPAPAAPGVPNIEAEKRDTPTMENNQVAIPAIDVKAPITFRVNNTPKESSAALQDGVIHINGTALPGEKGNIYMTGHSSNYIWAKGDYNSVFALLDKMVVGDKIFVKFNQIIYEYKVFDKNIVVPTDISVMQKTADSRLTLVTCWPVGTSLKRMIILANQVYPDPKENSASNETLQVDRLPSGR